MKSMNKTKSSVWAVTSMPINGTEFHGVPFADKARSQNHSYTIFAVSDACENLMNNKKNNYVNNKIATIGIVLKSENIDNDRSADDKNYTERIIVPVADHIMTLSRGGLM